jgi:hypothetical protein
MEGTRTAPAGHRWPPTPSMLLYLLLGLSSDFFARLGCRGPGTLVVPGVTGSAWRGAAPIGSRRVCACAGTVMMAASAAMPISLIIYNLLRWC